MRDSFATLWIGNRFSPYEELCLSRYGQLGADIKLYAYEPIHNAPRNVRLADANEIVPARDLFENPDKPGSFALFSDYFRYRMLRESNHIWVDTDIFPVDPSQITCEVEVGFEDEMKVNGAVLALPKESAILVRLLEQTKGIQNRKPGRWGFAGPDLISSVVNELNLWEQVSPREKFYPIGYWEIWQAFDPRFTEKLKEKIDGAATVHLWNEYLGLFPNIKKMRPPAGSIVYDFFETVKPAYKSLNENFHEFYTAREMKKKSFPPRQNIRRRVLSLIGIWLGIFPRHRIGLRKLFDRLNW